LGSPVQTIGQRHDAAEVGSCPRIEAKRTLIKPQGRRELLALLERSRGSKLGRGLEPISFRLRPCMRANQRLWPIIKKIVPARRRSGRRPACETSDDQYDSCSECKQFHGSL